MLQKFDLLQYPAQPTDNIHMSALTYIHELLTEIHYMLEDNIFQLLHLASVFVPFESNQLGFEEKKINFGFGSGFLLYNLCRVFIVLQKQKNKTKIKSTVTVTMILS